MTANKPNVALATLVSVFFFWGFVAASNDILIPVFKEKLNLEQWQSQLISFAFYMAYTVGCILYYLISKLIGQDILNKIGYKNGIALGLVISALGALLFYPAAEQVSFTIMIVGLFIVGLGFSLQQIVANPLIISMGSLNLGSQRLSLAGGVNNIGTTIGPLIVSIAIFGTLHTNVSSVSFDSVKTPYLVLGVVFVVFAIIFKRSSIPNKIEAENTSSGNSVIQSANEKSNALHYPQLWMGMIGIFVYVGVEVSTASNLPEYMKHYMDVPTNQIAPFVSLFWASLMIGRWTSSVGIFRISTTSKNILKVLMPYLAFVFFLFVIKIAGHETSPFYAYALVIPVMIIADYFSKGNPAKQLLIFSLLGIIALFVGMLNTGITSVYAFISVGLFCSTLWPCIFTLAIAGLGKHTNQGSSFLIMMIMGGGIISVVQGILAHEDILGIRWSYLAGVACFTYLAFYAWKTSNILLQQGINYDTQRAHREEA